MRKFFSKYIVLTRRGIAAQLEYRMAMAIWILSASFPLVMLAVWLSLAAEGPVGSFSAGDFVGYYLLSFYVRQMTAVWVAWELDYDIRHGDLNIKLLHPIAPIHEYIAFNLADKVIRGILFTPLVIGVAWLIPTIQLAPTAANLFFFGIALAGAWTLRYLAQFTLGLFTFWFSQALVLMDVFWMLYLLLGGGIAPLELLPEPLKTIAFYLPFRLMMSFPIEIMMGRLDTAEILSGLAATMVWGIALVGAYRLLWARGMRRFGAFGA